MLTCLLIQKDHDQPPRSAREDRVERGTWFVGVMSMKRVH